MSEDRVGYKPKNCLLNVIARLWKLAFSDCVFGNACFLDIKKAVGIMAQCRWKAKMEKKKCTVRFSQLIMDKV